LDLLALLDARATLAPTVLLALLAVMALLARVDPRAATELMAPMVLVALLPNLVPLVFIAGVMGFFGIDLKVFAYQPSLIGLGVLNVAFAWAQVEQTGTACLAQQALGTEVVNEVREDGEHVDAHGVQA
jgi:hypothetical protein